MKYAIVIGVENHRYGINKVHFAERDAEAFKKAMLVEGCNDSNVHVLLSEDATTSNINSTLQKLAYTVTDSDELVLFFAGHGEIYNGRQFLITYDTSLSIIENTALPLDDLFMNLRSFKRVTIFLDSCHSGMQINPLQRGRGTLKRDPFELLSDLEYQVAFASCKNGEKSYGSDKLQHGIWTYHVIEALKGKAPVNLYEPNGELQLSALQRYLYEVVPSYVKGEHGDDKVQTPWLFGGYTRDFSVRQAQTIHDDQQNKEEPKTSDNLEKSTMDLVAVIPKYQFNFEKNIELIYKTESAAIRNLSGFKKGHKEPNYITKSTKDFVSKIADDDIKEELSHYLRQIQDSGQFKDSQIVVENDCIDCNEVFYIMVSVAQDDETPSKYIMRTELIIHSGKTEDFLNILPNLPLRVLDRIVYRLPYKINIKNILNSLEQEKEDNIYYDYTPGNIYLVLSLEDKTGNLTLVDGSELIEFYSPNSSTIEIFDDLNMFLNSIKDEEIKALVNGFSNL